MFQVPNAELFYLTQKNTLKKKTIHDELQGKKVVVYLFVEPTLLHVVPNMYQSLRKPMMKSNLLELTKFIVVL